ncbi:hypothetical protein LAV73_08455 [Lysinibacillus xylanilyticus]|nr:hypothetical protein [Lysinibacillus xylanilyticus]MEB2280034.1 hypothetical protein [Lysinibacillus xylanilyticus]
MGVLKKQIQVGVITSLLLTPTAIANAQEGQPQTISQENQVANVNIAATNANAKSQTIAQYGKLSEKSTTAEMAAAKRDLAFLSDNFDIDEIEFITAKYNYIEKQIILLSDLKNIGTSIKGISYTSKTFIKDVNDAWNRYQTFLGATDADKTYLYVQQTFKGAVNTATNNKARAIVKDVTGKSLQYDYEGAALIAYFKSNGADITKLLKMVEDATVVDKTVKQLETLVLTLSDPNSDATKIKEITDGITTELSKLTADQKKIVIAHNLNSAAVTPYKKYTEVLANQSTADKVIALVEKLDPTAKDYTTKAKAANTAYLKLDPAKREYVKNYKSLKDQVEAMDIVTRIMALNPSQKTYTEVVTQLTADYGKLSSNGQQLVTNYSALQTANGYITTAKDFDNRVIALANEPDATFVGKVAAMSAEYKTMDKNAKKLVTQSKTLTTYEKNNANVVKVINAIAALNPANKDYTKKVLAARKAYNALDSASQKRVTNYNQLTAVEDVATLIGLIETLKPTSKTFLNDLDSARKNYDALPPEKQKTVTNYEKLVTAETELKSAHTVIALIDAAVPNDPDYLTKLMNARVAYDKLNSGQKKLVSNVKVLTDREKEVKAILNTMVQIDGIEPGTSKFVSQVNSARKAYDKLTKDQKLYVNNIAILQSYEPTAKVIELIGKLKPSSKTFNADTVQARALYDALSKDMQQYVTNYNLLQAAEASILGAGNVKRMIDELPTVPTNQYIKRIEEIRAAYNALPKDQQYAVDNYKTLQEQEKIIKPVISVVNEIDKLMTSKNMDSQYQKVLKAYDNLTATQRKYVYNEQLLLSLDNVIKVYQSIAALKPSDKLYFGMIESVRKDYDSLSTTDKQRVSNYNILLEAEKNMSEVKKVVAIIAGLNPASSTYIQDVANASAAYKALDSKVKGQVLNYDVLKKAEKDVAAVLKVVNAIGELDPDAKTFEKKALAAQKLYDALTLEQQDLVYNYRILQDHLKTLGLL